jgi:hypothetical protein
MACAASWRSRVARDWRRQMTRNQRNVLELACINAAIDPVLTTHRLCAHFMPVGSLELPLSVVAEKVNSFSAMTDEELFAAAKASIEDDPAEWIDDVPVPEELFESYSELYKFISAQVDVGELNDQTLLILVVRHIQRGQAKSIA